MKTLKDYEREFDNFMLGEYGKWKIGRVEVKQFYRHVFAELMEEAVGIDREIPDPVVTREMMVSDDAYQAFLSRLEGSNCTKAEIRERIKKMLE